MIIIIVYCGLRHFYIQHFDPPQADAYYILTHNGEIWDFSPELKQYGVNNQSKPQAIYHLEQPVLTVAIELKDFWPFSESWHDFSREYTPFLEFEYPHSWYLRFEQLGMLTKFAEDFHSRSNRGLISGIHGGGVTKLVAKLAAHNLPKGKTIIKPEHTENFLSRLPLQRFPLPENPSLEKLGIKTLGELGAIPLVELTNQFGQRASSLQRLGRGEDLVPFQAVQEQKYTWELDCTTLEGFFRPLSPSELKPYLIAGLEGLSLELYNHRKVTALLELQVKTASKQNLLTQRKFRTPTSENKKLMGAAWSLLPHEAIASLQINLQKIQVAPTIQLNMFYEPLTWQLAEHKLPARQGVELSRRERVLLLWEEYFQYE